MVAAGVEADVVAQHGHGFEEGAALIADVEHLASAATEEEDFEVVEADHDEGFVDVAAIFEHGGEGVLQFEAGEAGDVDVAEDGHLDVAVDVDEVAGVVGEDVAAAGVVAQVEGRGQLFLAAGGGDDDVELVVGGNGGLELVLYLDLAALAEVLQIVDTAGVMQEETRISRLMQTATCAKLLFVEMMFVPFICLYYNKLYFIFVYVIKCKDTNFFVMFGIFLSICCIFYRLCSFLMRFSMRLCLRFQNAAYDGIGRVSIAKVQICGKPGR